MIMTRQEYEKWFTEEFIAGAYDLYTDKGILEAIPGTSQSYEAKIAIFKEHLDRTTIEDSIFLR